MSAPTTQDEVRGGRGLFRFRIRTLLVLVACCAPASCVLRELWDRRPENALSRALRMMRSDDPDDRIQGTAVLSQMVILNSLTPSQLDAVMRPILVALRDPEGRVRQEAMDAIMCLVYDAGHGSGVLPHAGEIVTALPERLRDPAPNVHRNSMLTLKYIYFDYKTAWTVKPPLPRDTDRFADALCHVMERRGGETPTWAYQVLYETAPHLDRPPPARLLKALGSPYPEVRTRAIWTVVKFTRGFDQALPALFRVVESDDDPEVRSNCWKALHGSQPPPDAVPALVEGLRSRSRDVRFLAAGRLGWIGPKACSAVPALVPLLSERYEPGLTFDLRYPEADDTAVAAAMALGSITPGTDAAPAAEAALRRSLDRAAYPWRRANAEAALGRIRSPAREMPSGSPR